MGDGAEATPARVELRDVAVRYAAGPKVLEGVSLEVRPGEFLTILGPSGCGKSTVLNVVAGLLKPVAGVVLFDGQPLVGINTRVGYMTQVDTLLPWATVWDNVALPLKIRHRPRPEIAAKVDSYLRLLDIAEARDLFHSQLSGGMKRRCLLARSVIYDPTLILMDEPFVALDAQLRAELHIEFRRTVQALHQSVLFVTHDLTEAALLSDRVIVIGGDRPARPVAEFHIPFGKERDLAALRFRSDFAEVERTLNDALAKADTGRNRRAGTARGALTWSQPGR